MLISKLLFLDFALKKDIVLPKHISDMYLLKVTEKDFNASFI